VCALTIAYYVTTETLTGRTVGKLLTGTKVVGEDGKPPELGLVVVRTLIRFVPFDALSFLGGNRAGWHDRWSGTRVVSID
jgi:uncharacterized RDD family membrane protein YckC